MQTQKKHLRLKKIFILFKVSGASLAWNILPTRTGDYFDRISSKLPPLSAMVEERLSILTRIADVLGLDDLSFSRSANP